MAVGRGEPQLGYPRTSRVAVIDHDRRPAGLGLPRRRHATYVPAITDREQRKDPDRRVFDGVQRAGPAVRAQACCVQSALVDRVPEAPGHQRAGRQVESLRAENFPREGIPALVADHLRGHLDRSEVQPRRADGSHRVDREHPHRCLGPRHRVLVGLARLDQSDPLVEIERIDAVCGALVEVDRTRMDLFEGASPVDVAHLCPVPAFDPELGGRARAQARAVSREPTTGPERAR